MKPNLIAAFNELKTIKDWAKDERCKVPYITLKDRLKKGKDPEWALTEPFQKSVAGREVKVGDKLHRLTIDKLYLKEHYGQNSTFADCTCECGNTKSIKLAAIIDGNSTSCGCYKSEVKSKECSERNYKHGKGNLEYRLYKTWCNIKARCNINSFTGFENYGGRGITICKEWIKDFEVFEKWALANGYNDNLTIERKDVNGNYEPNNCKWVTIQDQQWNKRDSVFITAWGETKNLKMWGNDPRAKVDYRNIKYRIDHGWSPEEAVSKLPWSE